MARKKLSSEYIPVYEAARLLGCGVASLQAGLRNGSFPIGIAWCTKERGKAGRWQFRIPREPFMDALSSGKFPPRNEGGQAYVHNSQV